MPILSGVSGATKKDPQGNEVPLHPKVALMAKGPMLDVTVKVPEAIEAALIAQGKPIPAPRQGLALIDTGATSTCIHDGVLANDLKLAPLGLGAVAGVDGNAERPFYSCRVDIHSGGIHPTIFLPRATGADLAPAGIIALLGRDFLRDKQLVYNGQNGTYTISW